MNDYCLLISKSKRLINHINTFELYDLKKEICYCGYDKIEEKQINYDIRTRLMEKDNRIIISINEKKFNELLKISFRKIGNLTLNQILNKIGLEEYAI
jgi:hypothetical protein